MELLSACFTGSLDSVSTLLFHSSQTQTYINVNIQDFYGRTPFYLACQNGFVEIVKLLLRTEGVDVKKPSFNGETPFYVACYKRQIEVVKLLLKDERIDINREDNNYGRTPLCIACSQGDVELVKLLLNEEWIDVGKPSHDGSTPFKIACWNNHPKVVELLLNDGRIDVNSILFTETPFAHACRNGHIEIVKLLLNHEGVDVSKKVGIYDPTPIQTACHLGEIEIIEFILASGKEVNLTEKDYEGKSALDIARERISKEKEYWENESIFIQVKENCKVIVPLLESFLQNPTLIRTQLRARLGFSGKSSSLILILIFDLKLFY